MASSGTTTTSPTSPTSPTNEANELRKGQESPHWYKRPLSRNFEKIRNFIKAHPRAAICCGIIMAVCVAASVVPFFAPSLLMTYGALLYAKVIWASVVTSMGAFIGTVLARSTRDVNRKPEPKKPASTSPTASASPQPTGEIPQQTATLPSLLDQRESKQDLSRPSTPHAADGTSHPGTGAPVTPDERGNAARKGTTTAGGTGETGRHSGANPALAFLPGSSPGAEDDNADLKTSDRGPLLGKNPPPLPAHTNSRHPGAPVIA